VIEEATFGVFEDLGERNVNSLAEACAKANG
jgi:hypothetical protein